MHHTQEHYNDLMEEELNSNVYKNQDLYLKTQNTVPCFAGNSDESTMMTEQSV